MVTIIKLRPRTEASEQRDDAGLTELHFTRRVPVNITTVPECEWHEPEIEEPIARRNAA